MNMRRTTTPAAVVSLLMLAGSALGRGGCDYGHCAGFSKHGSSVSIFQSLRLQFHTTNAVVSGSGAAAATALADGGQQASADHCPCPFDTTTPALNAEADATGDIATNDISANSDLQSSGEATAAALATASAGEQYTSSSTEYFFGDMWFVRMSPESPNDPFCDYKSRPIASMAAAFANVDATRLFTKLDTNQPMIVIPEIHVSVRVGVEPYWGHIPGAIGCTPSPSDFLPWLPASNPTSPPEDPPSHVMATSVYLDILNADNTHTNLVARGVLRNPTAAHSDARLGFYATSAFAPNASGDITAINVPIAVGGTLANPQSAVARVTNEFFPFNSADLDRDGLVCWRDRVLMNAQLGRTLSSFNYSPQADFDLDGAITATDTALFFGVYSARQSASPPCPARCAGDVNYDGIVSTPDLSVLLGHMGQTTVPYENGDANGDGVVNTADIVVITGNFGTSCL